MGIVVFSSILVVIVTLLTIAVVLYYKDREPVSSRSVIKSHDSLSQGSIIELTKRISTEKLDEKELLQMVSLVAKEHVFPSKNSGESVENHLAFIRAFCLNTQTKGSTIVKMSNTLKAVNPEYKQEIEKEETAAIKQRDKGNI